MTLPRCVNSRTSPLILGCDPTFVVPVPVMSCFHLQKEIISNMVYSYVESLKSCRKFHPDGELWCSLIPLPWPVNHTPPPFLLFASLSLVFYLLLSSPLLSISSSLPTPLPSPLPLFLLLSPFFPSLFLTFLPAPSLPLSSLDSGPPEPPSTLLWTIFLLAQHCDRIGDSVKAVEFISEAIEHTPTDVRLYMLKARIYKVWTSASW